MPGGALDFTVDFGLLGNIANELRNTIERAVQEEAIPFYRSYAFAKMTEAAAKSQDEPYVVSVDGVALAGIPGVLTARVGINGKRRGIFASSQIHFAQRAVTLAVSEFESVFRQAVGQRAIKNWKKAKPGDISAHTMVVLWQDGKRIPITNVSQIKTFQPGDQIWITSTSPWQMYLNTTTVNGRYRTRPGSGSIKHGMGGFFGLAAKSIRTKLRTGPSRKAASALWVGAARSRGLLKMMPEPELATPEGVANWNKLKTWGAWGILIKYSSRTSGTLNYG